jgi:hypothetical protein
VRTFGPRRGESRRKPPFVVRGKVRTDGQSSQCVLSPATSTRWTSLGGDRRGLGHGPAAPLVRSARAAGLDQAVSSATSPPPVRKSGAGGTGDRTAPACAPRAKSEGGGFRPGAALSWDHPPALSYSKARTRARAQPATSSAKARTQRRSGPSEKRPFDRHPAERSARAARTRGEIDRVCLETRLYIYALKTRQEID